MPNIWLDNPNNFDHDQTRITLKYNVLAVAGESLSDVAVRAAVIGDGSGGFAPATYAPAGATVPWPIRGYRQTEVQPGVWKVEVTYSSVTYTFAFDLSGGDQTVYQSKQTVKNYSAAGQGAAPDCKQAINQDENTVHGASIYVPSCSWTETLEVPVDEVDGDYKKTVYGLIGHTNDDDFRGLPAKSVLFRGCSGSVSTANPLYFSLTFKFAYEPNRTVAGGNALKIGDIANVEKNGWEYLWVKYKKNPDPGKPTLVHQPEFVYVERVYDEGDFSKLNIGAGDKIVWGGA